MANGRFARFRNKVFQAAVAALGLFPFPLQFEVAELRVGNDIAARRTQAMEPAIFDGPAFCWKFVLFEAAPAVRGFPVKEQFPTSRFLCGFELVCGFVCLNRDDQPQESHERA